jgi:hypothetical protein
MLNKDTQACFKLSADLLFFLGGGGERGRLEGILISLICYNNVTTQQCHNTKMSQHNNVTTQQCHNTTMCDFSGETFKSFEVL